MAGVEEAVEEAVEPLPMPDQGALEVLEREAAVPAAVTAPAELQEREERRDSAEEQEEPPAQEEAEAQLSGARCLCARVEP